jgi:hypothetical protein
VSGIALSAEQQQAVEALQQAARPSGRMALMGPAGSGKSTVLVRALAGMDTSRVLVPAPSHKALAVIRGMAAAAGLPELRLTTVASLCRVKPRLDRESGKVVFGVDQRADPLESAALAQGPVELLLLDEASMVTLSTLDRLITTADALQAGLALMGDPAQLPPPSETLSALAGHALESRGFVVHRLETVRRAAQDSPVLALATAARRAEHPRVAWPRRSVLNSTGSGVVVHRDVGSWLDAASNLINAETWDRDPSLARVITWRHSTANRISWCLRRRRWGTNAWSWFPGEVILAPDGIPSPGRALAPGLTPRAAELSLVEVGEVETITRHNGSVDWFTPARQAKRTIEITATTQASRCTAVELITGRQVQFLLEVPCPDISWQQQIHTLRKQIRSKVGDDRQGERFAALRALADLESWVPSVRHASTVTSHASQGSTLQVVFPATELLWGQSESKALTYVAFSRASHRVELLDQGAEFRIPI